MNVKRLFLPALAFLLGAAGGAGVSHWYRMRQCGHYEFINRDIACGATHVISKAAYIKLENDIRNYIENKVTKGDALKASVYFRDLRSGPVFGVNENDDFAPASLLKLPMVLTYFSTAEREPGLLEITLPYSADKPEFLPRRRQKAPPAEVLQSGASYAIEDLMRRTLEYSDNTAYSMLVEYMDTSYPDGSTRVLRTFHELGIIDPRDIADEVASVRGYASLFRVLYNVSYLPADASEKVLTWLIRSRFPDGLAAGVPAGVQIADKFGERDLPDGTQQVHDCGIVYYPDNPYLLCVMTKGYSWGTLTAMIAEISRMVYVEVDARR